MISDGNLEQLKKVTKTIPHEQIVKMKQHVKGQSLLIHAVCKERRDIVLWLLEIGANVNQVCANETALQRAIFRNNHMLVRDLIEHGANIEHKQAVTEMNMPMMAIWRENPGCLDIMLEEGAAMDYKINNKLVDETLKKKPVSIGEVHAKHSRWRRLRQFLKFKGCIETSTTAT